MVGYRVPLVPKEQGQGAARGQIEIVVESLECTNMHLEEDVGRGTGRSSVGSGVELHPGDRKVIGRGTGRSSVGSGVELHQGSG